MQSARRFLLLGLLTAVVFALPVTVLANKQIFKAILTTDAELHEVVGSNAQGEGDDGNGGEPGRAGKGAQCVAEIEQQAGHGAKPPGAAVAANRMPEFARRKCVKTVGFLLRDSGRHAVFGRECSKSGT